MTDLQFNQIHHDLNSLWCVLFGIMIFVGALIMILIAPRK